MTNASKIGNQLGHTPNKNHIWLFIYEIIEGAKTFDQKKVQKIAKFAVNYIVTQSEVMQSTWCICETEFTSSQFPNRLISASCSCEYTSSVE